jgi:catechol 2,3-dioxygenase-like lactoylglutathione lyase family enzyme
VTSRLVAVSFDARDPAALAAFWGGVLDRDPVPEPGGALLPGTATQVGLRFVAAPPAGVPGRLLHLHLTSEVPADQERTVAAVLALGGRHLDVGQTPEEGHVVLADPEGNALCVIEAGNGFLSGCGRLGEVACDGSRRVGVFWSDALGWPLVWDQDEETAVQSPLGGTKLSWGGPPVAPKRGRNPQRFDLATDDVPAEVARLVALGASLVDQEVRPDGRTVLADPDGNELTLAPG